MEPLKDKRVYTFEKNMKGKLGMHTKTRILTILASGIFLLLFSSFQPAACYGFNVQATVDKDEVVFGDSVNLTVVFSYDLNSGGSNQISVPRINQIPGFDIAGTRTAQSQQWVNGVGVLQYQMLFELVPQKEGEALIPAFAVTGPDGKTYSTNAIPIKVGPPEAEPAAVAAEDSRPEDQSSGIFKGLLLFGVFIAMIVAVPLLISAFMNRRVKPSSRWADEELNSSLSKRTEAASRNRIEDADVIADKKEEIKAKRTEKVDFHKDLEKLLKESADKDIKFYKSFFDLFRGALVTSSTIYREEMTPDELMKKTVEANRSTQVAEAVLRLSEDLEMVSFAGAVPERSFGAILDDAKSILSSVD